MVISWDHLIADSDVYQAQGDQAIVIFFFFSPCIKLAPASQTGNLLPELFSNMVVLVKPDVFLRLLRGLFTLTLFLLPAFRWKEGDYS